MILAGARSLRFAKGENSLSPTHTEPYTLVRTHRLTRTLARAHTHTLTHTHTHTRSHTHTHTHTHNN